MTRPHLPACPGQVTLVGAGPGDPDLLTLKALKALQQATLLLVDDLVNPDIVALADPQARVVYVGKRGGCTSTPQAFIERMMIQAARSGERVVRLKGGDPFIFGRGGEEVQALQAAGVPVSVVNGITSGLAAVTALGVPLTHRDHAHGVVFVTGHAQGADAALDWSALAACCHQARLTLVIYMGIAGVQHIQRGLLHGLPAETPAAVVQHASMQQQRHTLCTLGTLSQAVAEAGLGSPSVLVIGEVLSDVVAGVQRLENDRPTLALGP